MPALIYKCRSAIYNFLVNEAQVSQLTIWTLTANILSVNEGFGTEGPAARLQNG